MTDSKDVARQSKRISLSGRRRSSVGALDELEDEKEEDFFESISFKEKRAMYIKGFVQLLTFFVFLIIFTATVLASQSIEQSQLANHVTQLFTVGTATSFPLANVRSIDDYWQYVHTTFMPAVFSKNPDIQIALDMAPRLLPIDLNNRIIGSMRFWQVRVQRKEGCQVGAMFEPNYKTNCFQPLLDWSQDKEAYGPDQRYKYSEDLQGSGPHEGLLGVYPPSGHVEVISQNETKTNIRMTQLQQDGWIGAPTRAVFIDYTVWNMNLNLHAVIRIVAEFSMSGVCETNVRVIVVQPRHLDLLSTSGVVDMFSIIGEFALVMFILFYIAEEITEFSITWQKYFLDPWNVIDWLNLILLIIFVWLRGMIYVTALGNPELGEQELVEADYYSPMQDIAERLLLTRTINAFNAVLIWTKVVKYVGFMPYVKTLLTTLETCWRQYLSFLFMFLVIFLAFVIAYTIGFGETIRDLSGIGSTSVYLARSFLGDIDLTPVYEEAPVFGAILILFFMLGIYFLMMNVFFAIILSALDEAKDKKVQDFRQEMLLQSLSHLKETLKNIFSIERHIRAVAPGLWAQMYKKTRMKRKQEEKKKALEDAKKADANKKPIAHDAGGGRPDDHYSEGASSGPGLGAELDKKDVLSAIEFLAGKLLSKIQGLSFELTTEMRDLQSALTKMEGYSLRLVSKLEDLYNDQSELLTDKQ
jgi:hypothetical protein